MLLLLTINNYIHKLKIRNLKNINLVLYENSSNLKSHIKIVTNPVSHQGFKSRNPVKKYFESQIPYQKFD